jgi:hypothetical protein
MGTVWVVGGGVGRREGKRIRGREKKTKVIGGEVFFCYKRESSEIYA